MLPFLKPKHAAVGLIVTHRKPDEPGEGHNDQEGVGSIEYCAQDLIKAVHAQDPKAVAQALKDVFDILESQPHDEVSHEEQE